MSAVVIDFASAVAQRAKRIQRVVAPRPAFDLTHDFTFWNGASGARYVHTVYALHDCPELPDAVVVLARRDRNGQPEALHVGSVEHGVPSSNLAEVRRAAARLGASEVHVHLLAAGSDERGLIVLDLTRAEEMVSGGFTRH